AVAIAAQLQRPQRELRPERRRLGVDTVGAPGDGRVAELACPRRHGALEIVDRFEQQVARPDEGDRQRRVDDVARRQPVVYPRAGGEADGRLDHVDEGGDVVVGYALAL